MTTPKIYVADLAAYNEGKLVGEWLELTDYTSGEEVMKAISELLEKFSKEQGVEREEFAIHDYEGFPSDFYSEYMGKEDFDKITTLIQKADESDLPYEVLMEYASVTGVDISDLDDIPYNGRFDSEEAFAEDLVEQGVITDLSRYLEMYPTDMRILAQEEADNRVENMDDDDLLEEAGYKEDFDRIKEIEAEIEDLENKKSEVDEKIDELYDEEPAQTEEDVEKFDEKIEEFRDRIAEIEGEIEMLNDEKGNFEFDDEDDALEKAKEKLRDEYYDEIYDELSKDPVDYFVSNFGYEEKDLVNQNSFTVDYEALARDLSYDYTFVEHDGDVYVFSQYAKGGRVYSKGGGVDKRVDLFEDYENIPSKIQVILDKYSEDFEDGNYKGLQKALKEVEAKGYTFEYDLDGQAYGLRPKGVALNELSGFEDMNEEYAKGGELLGNKKYKYSITYSTITEESAEIGDFEDTGYEIDEDIAPLYEILEIAINDYGISSGTSYPPTQGMSWESVDPVNDRDFFEKGISKFYQLHIQNTDGSTISEKETIEIDKIIKSGRVKWDEIDEKFYKNGGGVDDLSKVVVYDNGGESFDRYTVFTPDGAVYGMSENAEGFNQYVGDSTEIKKGSHLGKKLKSVPEGIKKAVLARMEDDYEGGGYMAGGFITKDNIKIKGLKSYTKSKKSGSFYNFFATRDLGNRQQEMWWIRFKIKNGHKTISYIKYRYENNINEYEPIYEDKNITLEDLPKSLLIFYKDFDGESSKSNKIYQGGGEISKNIDYKLKELGFELNKFSYKYGKKIDENDYISAFYDKNKKLYKIRGVHKYKTPFGQNSIGIQFDFDNEKDFFNKIKEYLTRSGGNSNFKLENGGYMANGGGIPEGYHQMPDGTIMADSAHMEKGAKVPFKRKVKSISESLLERKKVPSKLQKDYGKTYSKKESIEAAKRIAGAMRAKEKKMMIGGKVRSNKKQISTSDLERAALLIRKEIPESLKITGKEFDKYKFGAYSFEAWEEVANAMKQIGLNPSPNKKYDTKYYDNISNFVSLLKSKNILYLEW